MGGSLVAHPTLRRDEQSTPMTGPDLRRSPAGALVILLATVLVSCGSGEPAPSDGLEAVHRLVPRVVATHPHDPESFTQGLELVDGRLFETTGLHGRSGIRELDRSTGRVLRSASLDPTWFGEGFTALGDGRALQLTWKAGRAIVWNLEDLTVVGTRTYGGQGWGLCRLDGATLVQSDGSATLTLRNLDSFQKLSKVEVTLDGRPVDQLNELECVNGTVWANVWRTDRIVAVEVPSGRVTAVVDASDLVADRSGFGSDDVLNGIAHDPEAGRFLLTGKRWPVLFEVVFEPIPSS
jgi:glutaminyl-peptide cyclotransferase